MAKVSNHIDTRNVKRKVAYRRQRKKILDSNLDLQYIGVKRAKHTDINAVDKKDGRYIKDLISLPSAPAVSTGKWTAEVGSTSQHIDPRSSVLDSIYQLQEKPAAEAFTFFTWEWSDTTYGQAKAADMAT